MKDDYVPIAAKVPYKTVIAIEKMAAEYGLSKANMIMRLLEWSAMNYGHRIEVSSVSPDGQRSKKNIPVITRNIARPTL